MEGVARRMLLTGRSECRQTLNVTGLGRWSQRRPVPEGGLEDAGRGPLDVAVA